MAERIDSIIDLQKTQAEVDAVNKQIDTLIAKMQSVATTLAKTSKSSSGSGGATAKTELEQVAAQERELIRLNKQLEQSTSDHAKAVAKLKVELQAKNQATKQEAAAASDQIGAYKRLSAELEVTRAKAKDLAVQYGVNSKEAQAVIQKAAELDKKLKEVDAAVGQHQRKVGEYENATVSLRQQLREMTQQLASLELQGKQNTEEYQNLARDAGRLKDAMLDTQATIKTMGSDTRVFDGLVSATQGLIGAFSVFKGVQVLVGNENEDLAKTMAKLQALMAIMIGLQQTANMLQKESAASLLFLNIRNKAREIQEKLTAQAIMYQTAATNASSKAAKVGAIAMVGLSNAMKAIPFVAIISLAATLVKIMWDGWKKQRELNDATEQGRIRTEMYTARLKEQKEEMDLLAGSMDTLTSALDNLGSGYAKYAQTAANVQDVVNAATTMMNSQSAAAQALSSEVVKIGANFNNFDKVAAANMVVRLQELYEETQGNTEANKTLREAILAAITGLSNMGKHQDDLKKSVKGTTAATKEYSEVLTLTFEDLASVDRESVAWKKSMDALNATLKNTATAIPEISDELDKLDIHLSFIEKSFAELGKQKDSPISPEYWKELGANVSKYGSAVTGAAGSIFSYLDQQDENYLQDYSKRQQEQKDILQGKYDAGLISQEQYNDSVKALDAEFDEAKKQREKEQFERNKALRLAEATVNSASALISVWASTGSNAEKIILSALQAAEFIALIAQISSAQYAGYATGREGGPAEKAWVGEEGWEYRYMNGKLSKTPDKPTLTNLRAGESVIPHEESVELERMIRFGRYATTDTGSGNNEAVIDELRGIRSAMSTQPGAVVNINQHGFKVLLKNGYSWQRHIDNNIKFVRK